MRQIIMFCLLTSLSLTTCADNIAIIGGGASGLISAFLLEKNHDVTIYESQNRLGGHINTIYVNIDGKSVPVEGGAEFFNSISYPHFMRLLRYLKIPLRTYSMVSTFYTTDNENTLILPPYHDGTVETVSLSPTNIWRMIQLKSVISKAHKLIEYQDMVTLLSEFINTILLDDEFVEQFFYPFLASSWGVSPEEMKTSSAYVALKYLVDGSDGGNYEWYEVKNGLNTYIEAVKLLLSNNTHIYLNSPVTSVVRENDHYVVTTDQGQKTFDHVVFSTNPNITATLLSKVRDMQHVVSALGNVRYYDTKIAIHSDPRFMPANRNHWRVVNIAYNGENAATTIYKQWKSKTPLFKSWLTFDVRYPDDQGPALPNKLHALIEYRHPYTDHFYIEAQNVVDQVQGYKNLWFVGAWSNDNVSQESALISAVKIAERLAPNTARLRMLQGTN